MIDSEIHQFQDPSILEAERAAGLNPTPYKRAHLQVVVYRDGDAIKALEDVIAQKDQARGIPQVLNPQNNPENLVLN